MGKPLKILVSQHAWYNYQDSVVCQGLQNLGHEVYSYTPGTNYIERSAPRCPVDLFIQFIKDGEPLPNCKSIFCWGEDDKSGLDKQFQKGFDHVFVRDHRPNQPGVPMNFGIETRYFCITDKFRKPLKDRPIDICFLGQLTYGNRNEYVERLKKDFSHLNLMLGPRQFNTPDDYWSHWTKPWCSHDPKYFETLANSKIVLSFKGVGPDTGRFWECLASGGIVVAESSGHVDMVRPTPEGVNWFFGYEQLHNAITESLNNLEALQEKQDAAWHWNREHHSTTARARYLLQTIGLA